MTFNKLLIASHNQNKIKEIISILHNTNIQILSNNDISFTESIEDGITFEENALIKARNAYKETKIPSLADDSGFSVKALQGAPGVYSARFAKECGSYEKAFAKLQEQTKNFADKEASFICVFALCLNNKEFTFKGEIKGTLSFPPRGKNGFAYDSIFIPNGYNKTFAELDHEIKNSISHRKKALDELLKFIEKQNAKQ